MTRILADENVPKVAVDALRERGHDVEWVRTDAPGIDDENVLERAGRDSRVLVTFDKDFAQLVFRDGAASHAGILLFRLRPASPDYVARRVVEAVEAQLLWQDCFATVRDDVIIIRRTAPPPPPSDLAE